MKTLAISRCGLSVLKLVIITKSILSYHISANKHSLIIILRFAIIIFFLFQCNIGPRKYKSHFLKSSGSFRIRKIAQFWSEIAKKYRTTDIEPFISKPKNYKFKLKLLAARIMGCIVINYVLYFITIIIRRRRIVSSGNCNYLRSMNSFSDSVEAFYAINKKKHTRASLFAHENWQTQGNFNYYYR